MEIGVLIPIQHDINGRQPDQSGKNGYPQDLFSHSVERVNFCRPRILMRTINQNNKIVNIEKKLCYIALEV